MPKIEQPENEGFQYPEDLTALTPEELAATEQEALDAFDALRTIDDPTDEQVAEMEALAGYVEQVRTEGQGRERAAQERRDRAEAAAQRIAPPEDEGEPGPDDEDNGEDAGGDDEGEAGNDSGESTADGETPAAEVETEVPVAASGARRPRSLVRAAAGRRPANPRPKQQDHSVVITAAADIKGIAAASRLNDMPDVVRAFMARSGVFPQSNHVPNVYSQYGVATFARPRDNVDGLWQGNKDYADDYSLVMAASRESRLPGGSLLAAGGWCAPSETVYDLCSNESLDGLVDLPTITVTRGGIRFTPGPDFAEIYAATCFWALTEAQAIAGTPTKTCCEVDCPDFEEIRLDAVGFCLKAPILTRSGYPELVQRWLEGTVIAAAHKNNARTLATMATLLGAPATVVADGGAWWTTLSALELAAESIRTKYRMAFSETMEVVLPHWVLGIIRADLSNRSGQPAETVSDAQITSHFTQRGLNVQWVYDWQDSAYIAAGCLVDPPDTVNAMIYPAGTFVKGEQDVISLDTIYDTTDLMSNMYTAAFVEDGQFVAQTCFQGCNLTLPLCANGRTGAADVTACFGEAAV